MAFAIDVSVSNRYRTNYSKRLRPDQKFLTLKAQIFSTLKACKLVAVGNAQRFKAPIIATLTGSKSK